MVPRWRQHVAAAGLEGEQAAKEARQLIAKASKSIDRVNRLLDIVEAMIKAAAKEIRVDEP